MNHIFGPVNSRRLGRSLGIDLLPAKVCNFDCIYCEVGPTTTLTCERGEYVATGEILAEIDAFCADPNRLAQVDVVTVTASGEPTLHSGLGRIISHLREKSGKPVAVLTNGTNLDRPDVTEELSRADIVIPSLDAALSPAFRKLNRPAPCVDLGEVVSGLVRFSRSYGGELWLEVLVVEGINDGEEDVRALVEVIRKMKLSRVQLNTVARPPLEKFARPVNRERLEKIRDRIMAGAGVAHVEIIAHGISSFERDGDVEARKIKFRYLKQEELLGEILQMLQRRPCTVVDIDRIFKVGGPEKVEQLLEPLVQSGTIERRLHGDTTYYQ